MAAPRARNEHGTIEYIVDAEADLATIVDPKASAFALAMAEGSLHFHTGSLWQEIVGGGGALDVVQNAMWYTRYVGVGTNLTLKYRYTYTPPGSFAETSLIDGGTYWVFAWAGGNGALRAFDPQGWLRTTAFTSSYWAGEVPANCMFNLPKGFYRFGFAYRSMGDPVPDTAIEPYLDYGESPSGAGILGEYQIFHDTYPEVNDLGLFPRQTLRAGTLMVSAADTKVIPAFSLSSGAANNAGIDFLDFFLIRIAEGV